jgi:hypothetical protein
MYLLNIKKSKVVPMIKNQGVTAYGALEVNFHAILNSALEELNDQLHIPSFLPSGKEHTLSA